MTGKVFMIGDTPVISVTEEQLAQAGLANGDSVEMVAVKGALVVLPKDSRHADFLKGVILSMERSASDYEKLAK